ncbi:MAG: S-layer homology domain-containing protein, partial [Terriglobales bacterium]
PLPGDWLVELVAIIGIGDLDVSTLPESVNGTLTFKAALPPTGLGDIANHPAESAIRIAVGERLMDGFSDGTFKPDAALTRIALADYLTMGAEVRQSFPLDGSKTFTDLTATQIPFAEAVAARSAALRDRFYQFRGVMLATAPGKFSPKVSVRRVDQAYSLVQALGLEKEALQLTGQQVTVVHEGKRIPIDDQAEIPAGFEGYVQLALDLNIMSAFFTVEQGPGELQPTTHARFKPLLSVTRGNYATDVTRFFNAF